MGLSATKVATLIFLALSSVPAIAQKSSPDRGVLEPTVLSKDLYPPNADAKAEIEEALKAAAKDQKRIILIFGANWCYDCHVLNLAMHEGTAGEIVRKSFILVHVDIGEGELNAELVKKYVITIEKGVPAIAILGSDGSLLYSSGNGEFEAARKMMKQDLLTFLRRWREPKP